VLLGKCISVLLREGEALAFVKSYDEDAGFRGLDNWGLGEGLRVGWARYPTSATVRGRESSR
jgi:hypothetical protein